LSSLLSKIYQKFRWMGKVQQYIRTITGNARKREIDLEVMGITEVVFEGDWNMKK